MKYIFNKKASFHQSRRGGLGEGVGGGGDVGV